MYMHWHPSLVAVASCPASVVRDVEIRNIRCKFYKATVTWPAASIPAEYTVILTAIQPYMAKKSGIFKGQSSKQWYQCYLQSMLSVRTHNYIYIYIYTDSNLYVCKSRVDMQKMPSLYGPYSQS